MDSIKDVLKNFNPLQDRYVSREYQSFGVHLSQKLQDERRKGLYIKLARDLPRPVLEQALSFVVDSNARKKGALFMWKLKELGVLGKPPLKAGSKAIQSTKSASIKPDATKPTSRTAQNIRFAKLHSKKATKSEQGRLF